MAEWNADHWLGQTDASWDIWRDEDECQGRKGVGSKKKRSELGAPVPRNTVRLRRVLWGQSSSDVTSVAFSTHSGRPVPVK